ncbi:MAG: alpha/beta hydrolase [Methylobacteriaceae bacterium]|nr:alpha/beta hydrolase [Methylobacteriaceae bacterium]
MSVCRCLCLWLAIAAAVTLAGRPAAGAEPAIGIALEGFAYPYPVRFLPVRLEGEDLRLAYMDVPPAGAPLGRTVVLLHGRNFPSSYWEPTIKALAAAGYRVVVPDQIGFGKSSKPGFAYSFDAMARTTIGLLDNLGVDRFDLVGHSLGGMLAVRIARGYGARIDHLVLHSPIGLEDYRLYVPPVTDERLAEQERSLSADGYRKQLMTNYALSLPATAIEPFVELREAIKSSGEYPRWLKSFVRSYQMIYAEPVVYEIPLIDRPTLFIMGGNDHNAPGRAFAPPELRPKMGQNAALATNLASQMRDARVVVFGGIGHLAHLESEGPFNETLLGFLAK